MATSTSKPQPSEQTEERKPRASAGTRKTTKKPSTRSKSKAKSGRQSKSTLRETCGLAIVGAAVFMLFCVFSGSDFTLVMGTRRLLFGTTGILAYFIPIVVGWFGAAVIFSDKLGEGRRRGYVITTLSFLVLAFIHLFSISEIDTTSYGYFFAASYEAGQIPAGTGAIGALLSYPLYFLFDWWGSALILFVSMLICVVAITRLSIRGLGENIRDAGVKVGTKMKDAIVEQAREAKEIRETRRAREMYREDILEDSGEAEYPQENNETNKKRGGEAKPGEEANERGYESPFDVKRRDPFNEPLTKIKDATRSRPGFSAEAKHGGSRFEIYNVDGEEAYEPEIYEDISESLESAEAEGPDSEELERQSRIEKFGYDDRYIPGIPKTEPRKARRSAMATRLRPVVPDVADIADGIVRLPDYLEKLRQPEADNYEEIDELDGIEKIISDTSILMPGDEELGSADILDEYDIGELNLEPRLNPIIEMEEADVSEIEYIAQQDEPMDLIALDNEYVADLHDDKVLSLEPVYMFPPLSMLAPPNPIKLHHENEEANVRKLEETFSSFGINVRILNVTHGPAITRYEIQPAPGVKVSRIVSLSDDIALNMAAVGVRIEAPIPGRAAIGIEVPNDTISIVGIRDVLDSKEFRGSSSKLSCAIGMDISGNRIVGDLADMPHILIAGATGAGKSVCISSIITSLLYNAKPEEVRLIMIDPKVVELSIYNGIPHLLVPVVTEPKKAAGALNWAVTEMTDRYKRFAELGVRNIKGYNKAIAPGEATLPQIVVIIDELADLMLAAPGEVEEAIFRLAQLARAAGIHLVIATQRPSVNVITGVIKANIPSRIAFAVASQIDSRTILDVGGAEKLLGRGDMLFFPRGASKPLRVQGCWVSDNEVQEIVDFIKAQQVAAYDENVIEKLNEAAGETPPTEQSSGDQVDDLLKQAIEVAIESGQASISMLQRRLRIGYARAGRLIDEMTQRGIISPADGAKPREVLISREEFYRVYGGADEFLIP